MPDTLKLSCGVQAICFSEPEMRVICGALQHR